MIGYLFQRRIFDRKFERGDGHFIYRRYPYGTGFVLQPEEKALCLAEFRRTYWRMTLQHIALLILLTLPIGLAVVLDEGREGVLLHVGAGMFLIGVVVLTFRFIRALYAIPSRLFPTRAAAVRATGYREATRILARQRSWWRHALGALVLAALAALFFPTSQANTAAAALYWSLVMLLAAAWLYGLWLKWSDPGPPSV